MVAKKWTRVLSLLLVFCLCGCGKTSGENTVSTSELSQSTSSQPALPSGSASGEKTTEESSQESSSEKQEDNKSNQVGGNKEDQGQTTKEDETPLEEETEEKQETVATELKEDPQIEEVQESEVDDQRKDDTTVSETEQRNSFSMMYYLAITAEEIRISKNNRLLLDDIYTSLLNDINPGTIDEITQDHLQNLRDIIKAYINISVKRDRLQYIYNQDKAAAMRSAVPNPIAILSMANACDWKKLAMTAVYTAVDSYTSYKNASENADKNFLMSGWELDDEELATVQKNRDRAFDYMVDMVQEYDLDGMLTLNEKAIEKFAQISAIESVPERTRRLESEEETYKLLGNYWLELANCYFESGKYEDTITCVNRYNELATGIYRQDFNYVKILPKAIVAAQNIYSDELYVSTTGEYADAIIKNTPKDKDNWSTRYFAAQVYLDLYARTGERQYLEKAYEISYDNVTILLPEQRNINQTYLNEVKEVTVEEPDYRYLTNTEKKEKQEEYKEEKKRAKEYNKELKETRKTELPALYEPLVLNCELLFNLADEMQISNAEKADIEAILKSASNGTFLTKPINDAYSFSNGKKEYSVELQEDGFIVPVELLSKDSEVTVTVKDNGKTEVFDDVTISKVERKGSSIDNFEAHYTSKQMKKHVWTEGSKVTIDIKYCDAYDKTSTFNFEVGEVKKQLIGYKVEFKEL